MGREWSSTIRLTCQLCQRTLTIEDRETRIFQEKIAKESGFTLQKCDVRLTGICEVCRKQLED